MLKAKVSASTAPDAQKAGEEVGRQIASELSNANMAFVYCDERYDKKTLLKSIGDALSGVPLIGNTSFTGVITPEGFISGESGFVGAMALEDSSMAVGVAGSEKNDDARATGRKVAKDAIIAAGKSVSGKIDAPDYFYMAAPPGEEEFYLKGIEDIIGRVPFFGGSSADNTISGNWTLYTDKVIAADGIAVAFFYTDENSAFANVFTGAYAETDDVGIITKVKQNRTLMEIDGEPALKKYASWRGMDPDKLMGSTLLAESVVSPLGVKDRLGELIAIRHPMNGNDDYTINVGNNLAVNTAVIRMEASVDKLISSAGDTLKQLIDNLGQKPKALHLVHCGGRRAAIDSRINEVYDSIKTVAGDIPFIVEFTFGEYGYYDDGNNTCGGLMLSFTAFA